MQVRCAQCNESIELAAEAALDNITCPNCDLTFSLITETARFSPFGPAATDTADYAPGAHGGENATVDYRFDLSGETESAQPERLGKFLLLKLLGSGAFGSVWLARDTELQREVAIKIPRPGRVEDDHAEMFFREARAAAQLKHPNIINIHEVGNEGGTIYIVSDFVRGSTMELWARRRPSPREVAEKCAIVAEALEHAHQAKVIHRDLKPANIMIDEEGQPHIMDFGLAKREAGEVTMTVSGALVGSPAYMSPEQARGDSRNADRRSDIYALGVIIYQLLTYELPFRGNISMLLKQIMDDEPTPPRRFNNHLPRDLEVICLKCMEKSPDRRYQHAQELADDLHRWMNKEPIKARPISRVERILRWCYRKPFHATAAGLFIALFFAVLVGFIAVTSRNRTIAEQRDAIAEEARTAKLQTAIAKRRTTDAGRRWEALTALREAAEIRPALDLRLEYLRCLNLPDLRPRNKFEIKDWTVPVESFLTFRKQNVLAFAGGKSLAEYDLQGKQARDFPTMGEFEVPAAYNETSDLFIAWRPAEKESQVWRLDPVEKVGVVPSPDGSTKPKNITFAADGKSVAFLFSPPAPAEGLNGSGDTPRSDQIQVFELPTLKQTKMWSAKATEANGMQLSPDGSLLALRLLNAARIWRVADTAKSVDLDLGGGVHYASTFHPRCIDFSSDGKTLAVAGMSGMVGVWDLKSLFVETPKSEIARPNFTCAHSGASHIAQFSPDGRWLTTHGDDRAISFWDAQSGRLLVRSSSEEFAVQLQWSSDSRHLINGLGAGAQVWETAEDLAQVIHYPASVTSLQFSHQGHLLAATSNQYASTMLIDLRNSPPTTQMLPHIMAAAFDEPRGPRAAGFDVTFSQNDQRILTDHGWNFQCWTVDAKPASIPEAKTDRRNLAIAIDEDDRLLVAGVDSFRNTDQLQIWRLPEKERLAGFTVLQTMSFGGKTYANIPSSSVAFSRDAHVLSFLESSNDSQKTRFSAYDLRFDRRADLQLPGFASRFAISGNGDRAAIAQERQLWIVDIHSGAQLTELDLERSPDAITMDEKGRLVVALQGNPQRLQLWDVESRQLLAEFHCLSESSISSVVLSGQGDRLAAGTTDGSIYVWRLNDVQERLRSVGLNWDSAK